MDILSGNTDLQTVISETDTLDSMTGDLLDYIRAEENGYILQKRNMDIVEKVGFICVNFKEVFMDKSIKLKFLHAEKQIMMSVDSKVIGKILTAILNYVSGYAVSWVEVVLDKADPELALTVRYDTYPVGERHADFMFKPFSQYSSTRSIGIGLSYARTLAQIHGGDLKFALEPSRRKACFTFCLPIEQSKEPETLRHDDIIINSALPLILIVEGNSRLLAYMKRHLKRFFNVLACSSAEEALQYIITWNVDLIVADLGLSGMNGMELCAKIRGNDATSHIPFVVIASSMSADVKLSCMKKGANQCIEMPFSMDYMKACLDNILENKSRVKTHVVHSRRNLVDRSVNIVDRDEAFLEKFETLIVENISNPDFSVKDMEQKLGFSRSSFNRKINALLGMSPNEYLRQRRLTLAAQMLERRNGSVSDICYKVGFNSPSYFAKCFREHFGVLPAEYSQAER
jgi:AraC-like DNA-binding protein